jgi:hypothetical protein
MICITDKVAGVKTVQHDNGFDLGEIIQDADGDWYWSFRNSGGIWPAYMLKEIVTALEDLNCMDKQITDRG